jgi:hypothetical protein
MTSTEKMVSFPRCYGSILAAIVSSEPAEHCNVIVATYNSNVRLHYIAQFALSHFYMLLGPTQPPIQCVPGALSLGVKRPEREADRSPPSSADVRNVWSYTSTPPIRLHGVVLN